MLALLLLLQVAGPPDAQKPLVRQPRCAPTEDDEVVVCARPGESLYRLKPLPPRPGDPPRDYWRVETTAGRRFWLFCQDGRWFLHGLFP